MSEKTRQERLFEIYEKIYYFEHERKEKLFSRVPVLIAIYSIMLGVMAACLDTILPGEHGFPVYCVLLGLALEALAVFCSGYYTCKFLWFNHVYGFLVPDTSVNDPSDNEGRLEQEAEPDQSSSSESPESEPILRELTAAMLTEEILTHYRTTSAVNYRNNQDREAYIIAALRFLIIGSAIALITSVPYFVVKLEHRKNPQKIEITDSPRSETMARNTGKDSSKVSTPSNSKIRHDTSGTKHSGSGLGTVYVRPGDTVEKSKKRGDWVIRK